MATRTREAVSDRLIERLEATRDGMRRYRRVLGLVWALFAVFTVAWLVIAADWMWVLAASIRGAGLVATAVAAAVVFDRLALRPGRLFNRDEAAAEVEATFPKLGQRVRTTLEYVDPKPETAPAAPGLVGALRTDTAQKTRNLDFQIVVPWGSLLQPLGLLAFLIAAGFYFLGQEPELGIAARRFLLLSGQYTTLEVKPGDATIKAGSEFTLQANLAGRPVRRALWLRRPKGSRSEWTAVSLAPEASEGVEAAPLVGSLASALKDCQADFEYKVVAGPVDSPTYLVKVVHPLELRSAEAKVEPPSYTRKPVADLKTGDFQVIEGSNVRLSFTLDRAPAEARIVTTPKQGADKKPTTVPLVIEGANLTGALAKVDRAVDYVVQARAADGMELEPKTWTIRVQLDEKPTLRFVKPAEELAVIATTEVPLEIEAADDFGLTQAAIIYQIGKGPKETLLLDKFKNQPLTARALTTLYLEKHKIDYTDGITYYAYAEDNYPPPSGPRRTTTELRFIDVLPFRQDFQLVEGGGTCKGSSVTLEELISRQRVNLNRTFALSEESSPEGARRLAATERELEAQTAEFTEGLEEKFGPVPSLHEAIDAMKSATSALEKSDAKGATPEEESALAGLIKARMNLRKLLKNSQSASACRKFDRQQQQKVRKPPPKKEDSKLAQLPQEIKKLAEEERKVCDGLGGSKPSQGQKGAPKEPTPSERQDAAAQKARELQKTVRQDPALSELARDRMDQAAGSVDQSAKALRADDKEKAADQAKEAAEQLERLAEQVAGLKAKELADKIARARDLARKLAQGEKDLGKKLGSGPKPGEGPKEQRGLAEGAGTLADWLKRLAAEAADESRELGRALGQAAKANPPGEIAEALRKSADALKAGQDREGVRVADDAAKRLAALARDLDDARRGFVQPRLDQLLAAEKQAGQTQKALKTARDAAGKAGAEKAMTELLQALEKLQAKDGALAAAAQAVREGMNQSGGWAEPKEEPGQPPESRTGYVPPQGYRDGVARALAALQAKIQELVLKNVTMDRDEAVPPQYKALVEDYYRTLSEDLR